MIQEQTTGNSSTQTADLYPITNNGGRRIQENKEEKEKAAKEAIGHPKNIVIPVYRNFKIRICKPLIPLKIALFIWFGGGSSISTYLLVFLKQRGMSLSELSIAYAITPAVQFFCGALFGVLADKIGSPKPVLIFNLLLTILVVAGMVASPYMHSQGCDPQNLKLLCHHDELGRLVAKTSCDEDTDFANLTECNVIYLGNVTHYCSGRNLTCEMLDGKADPSNISLSVYVSKAYKLSSKCYYNAHNASQNNTALPCCYVKTEMHCNINCNMNPEECLKEKNGRAWVLVLNTVLLIVYNALSSNVYRLFDVTAMLLVKEHDSDFGRERFFSIMGVLIVTPFVGHLVDITSMDHEHQNYVLAIYFFFGSVCLLFPVCYVLNVKIMPPGKNMWRKAVHLLKNPDVISLLIILLILGSSWGISKNFLTWYLEELNVASFLMGLIISASSLYGLPFLFTSNWWVKKIGTTQIFLLALLGYVICAIGYSFLYDARFALLIETTSIITFHLVSVAIIVHSHSIAPVGLTATVISAAGGIHFNIGRNTGSVIFGSVMNAFGGRTAYLVNAVTCSVTAVIYAFYIYLPKSCFKRNEDHGEGKKNTNGTFENEEKAKDIGLT